MSLDLGNGCHTISVSGYSLKKEVEDSEWPRLVTDAAFVSLHETEKPELRIALWGNLVFYTGGERMKEWNGAGDPKEPAGERKNQVL
ncbi:hypothetical protein AV530_010542 [Patagioenas fasciata monilis]|uniref:Uncharacterized protein n=1 Tax=Patagioenas fasciata monilis TaxID=372326 RepID=A0A1V4KFL5_PATFA|nr:hypothetical protein AV530_010542 [Patagioenas fasciata monilis]